MARKMKVRAWTDGNKATVKAIIFHPMETGLRKDKKTGKPIPAHYITEVLCEHNGNKLMNCLWGPGVSKNPYMSFSFKNAKAGDDFKITWRDNQGETGTHTTKLS